MRILIVTDKKGTAIDRLAHMTAVAAPWHSYDIVDVHPKRPDPGQLARFEAAMKTCDVIDFRYWKTAEMLHQRYEITKPRILTHYNPYDLTRAPWQRYGVNVIVNDEQHRIMKHSGTVIPLPVDLDFWDYQPYTKGTVKKYDIIMVSNRIEAKKGVLPVVQMAHDLGQHMVLVGAVSDPEYFQKCLDAGGTFLDVKLGVTDEDLRELYHNSMMHICNSIDNFESGTMPILEAMACGTPVLTRRVGHVPDLLNGRNLIVRKGAPEDIEDLKKTYSEAVNDGAFMESMALEARHSLRYRGLEIYGWNYSKIYHQVRSREELVTVVVATARPPEQWQKTMAHILAQNREDMEIIVCDDSDIPEKNMAMIDELRKQTPFTLKFYATAQYYKTGEKVYGLGHARNKGIMEAEGKWICVIDDRQEPAIDAVSQFYARKKRGTWLWGVKDNIKKGFVENFSFVAREDIVKIGMFSDMITQYGGMTQEIRRRAELNGILFELVESATAHPGFKSSSRWNKFSSIAKSKSQCYKLYG